NAEVTVSGAYSDAGSLDTHSVLVAWGDGTSSAASVDAATRSFSATHRYLNDGAFSLSATVTDDDGASDSASAVVTVTDLAPVVTALSSVSVDENQLATVVGAFSD